MKTKYLLTTCAVACCLMTASATTIINGSFETGDFSGWIAQDMFDPFDPLLVRTAGYSPGFSLFTSAPTDGLFAATHGFDGGGPDIIRIGQDVLITPGQAIIEFDYRAGWDMSNFGGSTQARLLDVIVEVGGGGAQLASYNILSALPGTINLDTGNLVGQADLSPFAGQVVRLSIDAYIPENYTGPAFMQIDNVVAIPEPASMGLLGLISSGIYFSRRFFKA